MVARPDPMWGETPCAFVTLKPEASATAEEIIAFCRERLAHFKAPRIVMFEPLPKTSTGKIQKFVLRERAKGNAIGGVKPAVSEEHSKSREGLGASRPTEGRGCRGLRSVPLELEDFVLDAELLALQIGDRIPIRQGTAILFIDGAFEFGVLCFQRLDAILQRHALSSC